MIRVLTQVLVGLMLIFGTATLIPRAMIYLKLGRKGRGALYIFLGIVAAVFGIMSFGYAYTVFIRGY